MSKNLPDTRRDNLPAVVDPALRPPSPLSREEAQALTDRIIEGRDNVVILLAEAQIKRAWAALGFASWKHYIATEFDMSEANSYRLIDQARVSWAIERGLVAAEPALGPDSRARESAGLLVSGREAQALKGNLDGAVKAITESVAAGASPEEAVKGEVKKRRRQKAPSPRPDKTPAPTRSGSAPPEPLPPSPQSARDQDARISVGPPGPVCLRCKGTGVEPPKAQAVRHGADRPSQKDCSHPFTMRLGKGCGLCLKDPV